MREGGGGQLRPKKISAHRTQNGGKPPSGGNPLGPSHPPSGGKQPHPSPAHPLPGHQAVPKKKIPGRESGNLGSRALGKMQSDGGWASRRAHRSTPAVCSTCFVGSQTRPRCLSSGSITAVRGAPPHPTPPLASQERWRQLSYRHPHLHTHK